MADWRTVAAQQKQQLETKNAIIDHLNQQVRTAEQQVADLQFQLADAGEALATARTKTNTTANELLSKAQLKYDDLATKYGQVLNRARLAENDLEAAIVLYHQKEAELRTRAIPRVGDDQELERTLAASRAETQEARMLADKLRKEVVNLKRDNASLRYQNPGCDVDQDDEEILPEKYNIATQVGGKPTALSASIAPRRKPLQQVPTSQSSHVQPPAGSSFLTSIPVRAKAAGTKSSRRAPITPRKRKRIVESDIEESEDEANEEDEELNGDDHEELGDIDENELRDLRQQASPPPTPKRRRVAKDLRDSDEDNVEEFTFDAIISWHADGRPEDNLSDEDLKHVAEELWEGVEEARGRWEDVCGQYWQYDLEKPGRKATDRAQCVTKKLCGGKETSDGVELLGGPTLWRKGVEGQAACRDCVANGWPCFTWYRPNKEVEGRLLLLPLHDMDRKQKVQEGFEIRHWLNA
ncbi:hypothetical protein LTR56_000487 [Elasticomyces elasticus]|nr:hypothetical protein LTR22_014215 [Elasticomyces elasticus]KAK3660729.1 hypothetical protein LTR56_000487 [Elasticomyces elasticus]KAK4922875.1 hypothetical protein LTR49_009882 [Elasticomyces elasticus]KAK5759749.1 hypothetical protein LTS12_010089 [Elasticomyces elasticus]